ncbi:T9SS type A sorting domain-containing protein, partial [Crocinitomix catalasitica]|nr:T9SS type A sorting domain-containing protein [Crocinitomix catalasitica]
TYSTRDNSPYGLISYYRLKQTDFDGNFSYSNIESVEIGQNGPSVMLFPNPTDGGVVNVSGSGVVDGEILVVLYNTMGELTYSKVVLAQNNGFIIAVDMLDRLPPGLYFILGTSKFHNEIFKKRLIIR